MKHFSNLLLFLLSEIIVQEISASCVEVLERPHRYYLLPEEKRITKATLTCHNISSVTNLPLPPLYKHTSQIYPQYMVIKDSNVSTVPSGAFKNLFCMESVQLSGIHLRTIEDGAFTNLTMLKNLDLDNNELTELTEEMFSSLVNLEVLKLGNNRISHVDKSAFIFLKNLSKIYLQGNNISIVENDTFKDQEDIAYLDLSENPLSQVSINAVLSHKKMFTNDSILLLSNINLRHFDVDLSNSKIKNLNLSSNLLKTFDFSLIPKDTWKVDLSNNRIVSIKNVDLITGLRLYLSHNQIKTLVGSFINLKEIYLSFNSIEAIETSVFSNATLLNTIDLSHNKLKNFDKNVFSGLLNLEKLDLSHNNLTKIDPISFKNLYNLRILNLSYNNLKKILFGTFESLHFLGTLDISNNKLIELKSYCFTSMPNLERLKLDNNQITTFDFKYLKTVYVFLKVFLENNPWTCKQLVEIYHTFKENKVSFVEGTSFDVVNYHGVACTNEEEVEVSFENVLQKVIDQSVADLKSARFFSEDISNSTFSHYFVKEGRILKLKIIQEISWLLEE